MKTGIMAILLLVSAGCATYRADVQHIRVQGVEDHIERLETRLQRRHKALVVHQNKKAMNKAQAKLRREQRESK